MSQHFTAGTEVKAEVLYVSIVDTLYSITHSCEVRSINKPHMNKS